MKIKVFDLEFSGDFYYIERSSIVEKIEFLNRTIYSRFERIDEPLTQELVDSHLKRELTLALPLITPKGVDYIVIEYEDNLNHQFYHFVKYLLKSIGFDTIYGFNGVKDGEIQIFIPIGGLDEETLYLEVAKIREILEVNSSKGFNILPDRNSPTAHNKVTIPIKKM